MAGGNSHQRAMARRARERIVKEVSEKILEEAKNKPSEGTIPKPPWYESTLLWGAFGAAMAIVTTVIAAKAKDLRWMLIVAWPFFCLFWWAVFKNIPSPYARRILTTVCSLATAGGLYFLRIQLKPSEPRTVKVLATVIGHSKILIENVEFGPVSRERSLPFNVYFINAGNGPAESLKHIDGIGVVGHILSAEESHAIFAPKRDELLADKNPGSQNEVQPNERLWFTGYLHNFTHDDELAVRKKKKQLYVLVAFTYKDRDSDVVHETGYCGFYNGNLSFAYQCYTDNYQK